MTQITINNISGSTLPFDIYVCDVYEYQCFFISTISVIVPPTVTITLPSTFDTAPAVLIKIIGSDGCEIKKIYSLLTPNTSPTPTPSVTPTNTPTPTVTPTNTPTPTVSPTPSVTPTNTPTPTPSSTPNYLSYLFIEPMSGSTEIGQWMLSGGSNFFGFSNFSQPTQSGSTFNTDMNLYVDFTGWTNGIFPSVITQTVPQISGGLDSFGNPIVQYNFNTTEVLQGSISGNSWFTWIIPISSTNNERQISIDLNINGNPNLLTSVLTESTINTYTFTYSGSTIPQMTYRVYTTFPNTIFQISDDYNIYFRGNTVSP